MAIIRKVLLIGSLTALASAAAMGEPASRSSGLEQIMGPEQYEAAGLHKLSDSERRSLYQWLRENTSAVTASSPAQSEQVQTDSPSAVPRQENFGFPEPPPDPLASDEALHARILQPFRGWNGKTVFHLDNGQVWQQRRSGRLTYQGDDTRIVITRNSWGFYEMRLIDADRSVGVKRIK